MAARRAGIWQLILLKTVLASFGALLATWLDPFGITTATDRQSAASIARLVAPSYGTIIEPPGGAPGPVRKGQSEIRVVIFDEPAREQLQATWPLDWSDHAEILDRIAVTLCPSVIFYDAVFLTDRGDPEGFEDFLATLGNITGRSARGDAATDPPRADGSCGRVEVVVGAYSAHSLSHAPTTAAQIQRRIAQVAYLGAVDQRNDLPPDSYILRHPAETATVGAASTSAAEVLYRRYRHHCRPIESSPAWRTWCDALAEPPPDRRNMAVRWGWHLSHHQSDIPLVDTAGCNSAPAWHWRQHVSVLVRELVQGVDPAYGEQRCPYHLTLPYAAIHLATAVATPAEDQEGELRDELRELMQDKIVLVGFDFSGNADVVRSPVQGQLPGVYIHAMALDNLIEGNGTDVYWHSPPVAVEMAGLTVGDLYEVGLLAAFVCLAFTLSARLSARHRSSGATSPRIERDGSLADAGSEAPPGHPRLTAQELLLIGGWATSAIYIVLVSLAGTARAAMQLRIDVLIGVLLLLLPLTALPRRTRDDGGTAFWFPLAAILGLLLGFAVVLKAGLGPARDPAPADVIVVLLIMLSGFAFVAAAADSTARAWGLKALRALTLHALAFAVLFLLAAAAAYGLARSGIPPINYAGVLGYGALVYTLTLRKQLEDLLPVA